MSQPEAVAVHLEDMDVVREAVEERAGEPLGAEAFMVPPSWNAWCFVVEREVD